MRLFRALLICRNLSALHHQRGREGRSIRPRQPTHTHTTERAIRDNAHQAEVAGEDLANQIVSLPVVVSVVADGDGSADAGTDSAFQD